MSESGKHAMGGDDLDETYADDAAEFALPGDDIDETYADDGAVTALADDLDETYADDTDLGAAPSDDFDETYADDLDETYADDENAAEIFGADAALAAGAAVASPKQPSVASSLADAFLGAGTPAVTAPIPDAPAKHTTNAPEIRGFTYVGRLGGGGFADVYRYRDSFGRDVAVKVLHEGMSAATFAKFEHEAMLMARFSEHPNIVTIYQSGISEDGRPFLVMEMYPGGSLATEVKENPYSYEKALEVGIKIAGAIETAHRMGVLHRDIKPSNILFNRLGHPALSDFGISVQLEAGMQATGAMSPQWAPPEQFVGAALDPAGGEAGSDVAQGVGKWSDVYALAATLWAAMEGHSPMWVPGEPNDFAHLRERAVQVAVPDFKNAEVPEDFVRVLQIALSKNPADRYQSLLDFARAMQRVQAAHDLPVTRVEVLSEDGEIKGEESGLSEFAMAQVRKTALAANAQPNPQQLVIDSAPAPQPTPSPFLTSAAAGVPRMPAGNYGASGLPASAPPVAKAVRKSRPGLIVGIVLAALVVLGGGVTAALLLGGGKETATVPQVSNLAGTVNGESVIFTWVNTDQQEGDTYHYVIENSAGADSQGDLAESTVTVQRHEGETCIQVSLVRADGSASAPKSACASE